jgi:hypothetical protein
MRIILILLVFVLVLSSCFSKDGYIYKQRRFYQFDSYYISKDTLFMNEFILYGTNTRHSIKNYVEVSLNSDSLKTIFDRALTKTAVPIIFQKSSKNLGISIFKENPKLKFKKININDLFDIAYNNANNFKLIPVIALNFTTSTGLSTSGADTYPHFLCFLDIAIFVIKNNKLVYFKNMVHMEKVDGEYHPYKYEDFHIPIPQEHWDGLVREVMKEYIERLK